MTKLDETFDLVVVTTTPGGIACALRGACEGIHVLLANCHNHIGEMFAETTTAGLTWLISKLISKPQS
jgi:hypothetical protein